MCSSPLSFDGAASSSATVHHISPPPSRSDFARRPGSALKKTSPASSSSSEDRKRSAGKVKRWKAGEGVLDHSESGKIRPGSAEGFFKGQRAPVRMILSTGSSSPSRIGHGGTHGGLDEVLPDPTCPCAVRALYARSCVALQGACFSQRAHVLLRAWPCFSLYVLTCCLVSASPFSQNQILNQMASPPTSIARKRPISATSKSQTGMDLTSASGELSSHVYGSWETGGGSLVRPDSAPPERRIRVIDKRGGSRREHTASQLQVATAASKPPELDFLLETFIDLEEVDATEHAQAGARSRQHWGDVGAKLGSIAQAAARQHNRGKGGNDRNRQTLEESSVPERRVAAGNPKISGSREVAFAWMKSAAKPGEFHNESHYQRALEQHSSPTRLRVRVTVKKPMVMSLILLPYTCLVGRSCPRHHFAAASVCISLDHMRISDWSPCFTRLHSASLLLCFWCRWSIPLQ